MVGADIDVWKLGGAAAGGCHCFVLLAERSIIGFVPLNRDFHPAFLTKWYVVHRTSHIQ